MSRVAIVGAGYVGLPLAQVFADGGNDVVLIVDVERRVVEGINRGESHIEDVPSEELAPLVERGAVRATTDYDELSGADAILIALATPLTKQRKPISRSSPPPSPASPSGSVPASSSSSSRPPIREPRAKS